MKNHRQLLFFSNPKYFHELYGELSEYDDEYIKNIFSGPGNVIYNGALYNNDYNNKYVTVKDGLRKTIACPEKYSATVYLFGSSIQYCYGSEDRHTIASFLQELFNTSDKKVCVKNYGVRGAQAWNIILQMSSIVFKPNDMAVVFIGRGNHDQFSYQCIKYIQNWFIQRKIKFIIAIAPTAADVVNASNNEIYLSTHSFENLYLFYSHGDKFKLPDRPTRKYESSDIINILELDNIYAIDLQSLFNRPHALGEVFFDAHHWNYKGNKKIAECFFQALNKDTFVSPKAHFQNAHEIEEKAVQCVTAASRKMIQCSEIDKYIAKHKKLKFKNSDSIGAIVMNANPFTKGHLHLIETALKIVNKLYIFIVETDKSYFSFKDRIHLVKLGVHKISKKNISVVPSGKFIISSFTFPGYFSKDEIHTHVDSSLDAMIFCSTIAPEFGITDRFVGEEPTCLVTAGYNETLKRYLLVNKLKLHIIPRIEENDKPISASLVRKYINTSDTNKLNNLISRSTYYFLIAKNYVCPSSKIEQYYAKFYIAYKKFLLWTRQLLP